jgi:hypothetical protein
MKRILFLGAGFSRNWGGWLANEVFEYLLGSPEVTSDSDLQARLWKHKDRGGFETTLEELQAEASRSGNRTQLDRLEGAILAMFAQMDAGFHNQRGTIFEFEFIRGDALVRSFLNRFDAIYTLNQDLLLERQYFTEGHGLITPQRWSGWTIPGMRPIHNPNVPFTGEREIPNYCPSGDFEIPQTMQPYFKLHGSANWRDEHGRLIIALGGNKAGAIHANNVLRQSFERFKADLSVGDTRAMIIGYGFADHHVNTALLEAANNHNLKIFIVDPLGVDACQENRTVAPRGPNAFQNAIIGASRRTLREILGNDQVERAKVERFFR